MGKNICSSLEQAGFSIGGPMLKTNYSFRQFEVKVLSDLQT
jgi:hypothetical protein